MENKEAVDLHIHTTFSNGKEDLITILKKAEAQGLKTISITDYNTLKAYIEMRDSVNISQYYTGKIIIGVEVRCRFTDRDGNLMCCDMIGYLPDLDNIDNIQKWLSENTGQESTLKSQQEQLNRYKTEAKRLGLKIDEELALTPDCPKAGMTMMYNILKYFEENEEIWNQNFPYNLEKYKQEPTSAWQEIFSNPKTSFYANMEQYYPELERFMEIIQSNRGLVFAAHPFAYVSSDKKSEKQSKDDLYAYLTLCKDFEINGIEAFNQYNCSLVNYGVESTEWILEFCKANGILISGGTDYHRNRYKAFWRRCFRKPNCTKC